MRNGKLDRIKGIHRVKRKLADGSVKEHHYAWRGGPKFWTSGGAVGQGDDAYIEALNNARKQKRTRGNTVDLMVDSFLDSGKFKTLRPRTRDDYRKWALRFAHKFRGAPAKIFEDPRSRGDLLEWQEKWSHSPKQADYAVTVANVILNWARGRMIDQHHCDKIPKLYKSSRAEVVWTPRDIEDFHALAPEWVSRILTVALETGLRPGDLIRLTWQHVEETPAGRRLKIRTNKRQRIASIPVTPALSRILDDTPRSRMLLLVSHRGRPLTEHRASEGVRQWRDKAGLPDNLRLQDCRGTAATSLLRANASLNQIAGFFGWSVRYAQNVIEHYATIAPEISDEVLVLLETRR